MIRSNQCRVAHSSFISQIPGIKLNRLTLDHEIRPFDCEEDDLNGFLFTDAKPLQEHLLWVTYLLETPSNTVAYFSVANDRLVINVSENRDFKHELRAKYNSDILYRLFEQPFFPAVKLGRFAVSKEFKRKGIGSELLDYVKYFFIHNNKTGCCFITVDALNKCEATNFYQKNGFEFLTVSDLTHPTRTMYYCLMI